MFDNLFPTRSQLYNAPYNQTINFHRPLLRPKLYPKYVGHREKQVVVIWG
uniref:Uncharacterized protein n=1 Tax=Lepeophtheirus salmonis TaxID=72036 RepID=A0A0K2UEH4_LEPSM